MVVVAYGMILPKSILQVLNMVASMCTHHFYQDGGALLQFKEQFKMEIQNLEYRSYKWMRLDTGPILGSRNLVIQTRDSSNIKRPDVINWSQLLLTVLSQIETGEVCAIKQNPSQACYAKKIIKSECKINWIEDAINLERSIRAFNPDSVMFSEFNRQRVKVWQASSIETSPITKDIQRVGTILRANDDGLLIKCGNGELLITEMQLPGKVKMKVSEILKSKREYFSVGSMFE